MFDSLFGTDIGFEQTSALTFNDSVQKQRLVDILETFDCAKRTHLLSEFKKYGVKLFVGQVGIPAGATNDGWGNPIILIDADSLATIAEDENADANGLFELFCHELCHVDQIVRGDLEFRNDTMEIVWRGMPYRADHINPYRVDYLDLPWEKEAHQYGIQKAVEFGLIDSVESGWDLILQQYREFEAA